jgi:hypothetical protein
LIALMVYTFARVGAVIKMRSEDVYVQGWRTAPCRAMMADQRGSRRGLCQAPQLRSAWPIMNPRARPGSMTGATIRCRFMA